MPEPEPEIRPERLPEQRPPGRGCAATAIIVLGLLILIPSGLCTGFMTIIPLLGAIFGPQGWTNSIDTIEMALIIGGPFVILGGFLTWLGFRLGRR